MKNTTAIFVIGCPRSGTSMTAALVHCCGAWGRTINDDYRQSGFHLSVLDQQVLEPVLIPCGGVLKKDRFSLPSLPVAISYVPDFPSRISGILSGVKYAGGPFVVRSRLLLPFVRSILDQMPAARVILVRRDAHKIGLASARTGWMSSVADPQWWQRYAEGFNQEQENLSKVGDPRILTIWPYKFLKGDTAELKHAIDACGLPFTVAASLELERMITDHGLEEKTVL